MIIYAYDGTPILEIKVDDSSYKYEEIMGDCNVYLEFALTQHIEIEPGSYIMFQGVKYEMMSRANVAIQHTRDYEYKATFSGPQARLGRYVIYDTLSGRLRFDMIGKPEDHLALVFRNLGMREPNTWEIGSVVTDKSEVLVSYNHTSVRDALNAIAEAFDTEWSVSLGSGGKMQINLRKLEFNKDNPLALGYGKNLGFKPGVGRVNYGDFGQVQKVWIDGGDRNLSIGEYGFTTLHFPKSLAFDADSAGNLRYTIDGQTYTEDGFDGETALGFVTDEFGASVKVAEAANNCVEASLDLTQHYPKRVGHVSDVRYLYKGDYMTYAELVTAYPDLTEEDWLEVQVDIVDDSLATAPGDEGGLDYSKHLFGNDQPLTVIFQTGQLMGREFNATFVKEARTREGSGSGSGSGTVVVRPANRFELVRTTIDGVDMPNAVFRPNANSGDMDEYIVVNIYLPDEYICNFPSFEGAEIDALRDAVKFIRENMDPQFSFKGTVDDVYARRNWLNIGGKLILGGCISFQNAQIQPEPIVTRIVGIKTYINKPYAPELTLSNETVRSGMSSMLAKLRAEDEHVMEQVKDGRRFSQRSFRDAKETIAMLAGTIDYFSEGIQPITVETMSLLVGYEALQFKFWTTRQCVTPVVNPVIYDPDTHTVVMPACVIQHMTLGIRDIMPNESRTYSDYLRWTMNPFESAPLTGVDEQGNDISGMAFYVYAKVDADNVAGDESEHIAGEFYLADENHKKVMQRKLEPETEVGPDGVTRHWYYLLVGILNSEYEGGRSFAPLYGFTEVLPGQITTDVIRSASGDSYFDLANNQFALGNSLQFINNQLTLRGTLVINGAGESTEIGAWCGQWTAGRQYAKGDEVWWEAPDGSISTYRYINPNPSTANASNDPSHTAYWTATARGVAGGEGAHGINTAVVYLYRRSTTQPDALSYSGELTYSFVEKALTSDAPSAWYKRIADVPASDAPLYVTAATAASNTNTDGIAANEWASPVILAENGTDGLNSATVVLYKRATSTPSGTAAKPSGTTRYTFETGVLSVQSGSLQNWSQNVPSGDSPCYRIQATAISTGSYDDIDSSEWSSPVKAFDNGDDGNGIATIVDEYCVSMDGSNHPADSAFDGNTTYPSNVSAGSYVWTRTTITYTDPNKTPDKFYSAQYYPSNGTNGTPGAMLVNRGMYDKNEKGEYDLDGSGNVIHQTYYGNSERRDVVYDNGMWYIALPTAGEFSNVQPSSSGGNAKWSMFATSLPNLATGLAFIEDLWVTQLNTAGKGVNTGKRVMISGNELQMYDGSATTPKLRITGDNLSGMSQSTTVNFREQYALSWQGPYNGAVPQEDESDGVSFTTEAGANLELPAIRVFCEGGLIQSYSGSGTGQVYFRFGWMLDDRVINTEMVSGPIDSSNSHIGRTVTMAQRIIPLEAGTHTVKLWGYAVFVGSSDMEGLRYNLIIEHTDYDTLGITYSAQKTEIGANGFQVAFGSERMLQCIIEGSSTTFMMQSNNAGVRVKSSGSGTGTLEIRIDGIWYYAKKSGSNLVLSTTP